MTAPANTNYESVATQLAALEAEIRGWETATPPAPLPQPTPGASYPGARTMSSVFTKQLVATEFTTSRATGPLSNPAKQLIEQAARELRAELANRPLPENDDERLRRAEPRPVPAAHLLAREPRLIFLRRVALLSM